MKALLKLAAFDFRLYLRDWITIFWVLVYPVLMLLLFGSMFGDQPGEVSGSRYIDDYVPALCALNVMSVALFTLNINMITYRENGILRRFQVTPIRKSVVLASHAIQGIVLVLTGAVEIIVIAKLVWDIQIGFTSLVTLIGCLLFGSFGFFSLGFAMSGLASTPGAASGFAMALFFPMLFLSGIGMPLDYFPQFLQTASQWIPMTYLVNLVQGVWQGQGWTGFWPELTVLSVFAAISVALAFILFRWENR
ncbi:ABC transporter permease [Kroppenstedtia pulmonis]|uniref:Transport permease protein n=1 Tax=Kroppenstedtia pulmonis TaxID=1380685 RepID=A0A7D3Y8Q5_9BACL|nr:ABC transporter permease [Kroppenstedtia pulmonis]QKG83801.1 ABC transporter permease [Kroppenstedtia pulmonis]